MRRGAQEITWKGLPSRADGDTEAVRAEKLRCATRIEKKRELLEELMEERANLERQHARNAALPPPEQSGRKVVYLPFLMVLTKQEATIDVEIQDDAQFVQLDFNGTPFEIEDEKHVMQQMGLAGGRYRGGGAAAASAGAGGSGGSRRTGRHSYA